MSAPVIMMGSFCSASSCFHFCWALVGLAAGQQLDHVKGICVQRHGANLAHHLQRDSAVVCQRSQFFHLVFQKELIVAAAGQQGIFCPGAKTAPLSFAQSGP